MLFCLAVGWACALNSASQVAEIDRSKLPPDAAVQQVYTELLPIDQFARNYNANWPYAISRDDVLAKFTSGLHTLQQAQKIAPTSIELQVFTGLVAHLAYNLDVKDSYEPAQALLKAVAAEAPQDYRPDWFLGMHQCQSNDTARGMERLLHVEATHTDLPGDFWDNYALCADLTNMPAHALYAYDIARRLGTESADAKVIAPTIRSRIKPSSTSGTYPSHTAWQATQTGDLVHFTSTVCGEAFDSRADSPIDIADVAKGTCVATISSGEYPARDGKSSPSLLLLTQPAKPGETLESFARGRLAGPRYATAKPIQGLPCPVKACLEFEIVTDKMYSKEGGAHLLVVAFASEQPDYPGLRLERLSPLPNLQKSDATQVLRPGEVLRRFDGTLYTFAALDANADIYARSRNDFEDLLKSIVVDSK
jgi:hypothetical protein